MKLRTSIFLFVALLFAAGSSLAIDLNNNGMSDVWEGKFSVPPDAGADHYDGDSFTNAQESLLGTDPYDRLSGAHLDLSRDVVSPNDWHLLINTEIGKIYEAQSTSDLATWWTVQSGIMGSGMPADIVVTLADESITKSFFRYRLTGETDADGDSLTLWEETNFGSSDNAVNSDSDTLSDVDEFKLNQLGILLDPALEFTTPGARDGDGDFDGDGVRDKDELSAGTNPTSPESYPANHPDLDLDFDALKDAWEVQHFGNSAAQDGSGNPDSDLITNMQEQILGTDPTQIRTAGRTYDDGLDDQDGDNVIDIWEAEDGTDPMNASSLDLATNFVVLQGFMEHKNTWGPVSDPVAQFSGVTLRAQAIGFENARPTSGTQTYGLKNDLIAPFTSNGSGNYSITRSMRFRKGVRYKVDLLNPNNVQQMPFVSGKYNWVSGGNADEPENVYFAYEVTNRQWYRADPTDTVSPILASPPKVLTPNPDVNNVHFTQKGPATGGPDATVYPTGTLFLSPFKITPGPVPTTGIDSAKIVFLPGLSVPEDISGLVIKVNGQDAANLTKDLIDPQTIYFTPPASAVGSVDVDLSGTAFANLPTDANNALKVHKILRYTSDSVEGTKAFHFSNQVNLDFVANTIKYEQSNGGISDDDALAFIGQTRANYHSNEATNWRDFFTGKSISEGEFIRLQAGSRKRTEAALYPYSAAIASQTQPPSLPTGVQVASSTTDGYEQGSAATFKIVRPTADASALTVAYSVSGTAAPGVDYTALTGSAVIPANQTAVEISVPATNDGVEEQDEETVIIKLTPQPEYAIGAFNQAALYLHDGNGDAGTSGTQFITAGTSSGEDFPVPAYPSRSFFAKVKTILRRTGKSFYYRPGVAGSQTASGNNVLVLDEFKKFDLKPYVVGVENKTIDDVIAENPDGAIILNGAHSNWGAKNWKLNQWFREKPNAEFLQTIGQVKIDGVVQTPTSTNSSKGSWVQANLRYWFGQSEEIGIAGKLWFFETINPTAVMPSQVYNGISGLLPLIEDRAVGVMVDPTVDLDLKMFTGVFGERKGYNVIGRHFDTRLLCIMTNPDFKHLSLRQTQLGLATSGVNAALVTDGGGSTACWAKDVGFLAKSTRHKKPVDKRNTVTSYLIFKPAN